jgi:hypothetical protein
MLFTNLKRKWDATVVRKQTKKAVDLTKDDMVNASSQRPGEPTTVDASHVDTSIKVSVAISTSNQNVSAASKVFSVFELLEMILLQLEPRVILTSCIRVCRAMRDVIESSKAIQRLLFREAASSEWPRRSLFTEFPNIENFRIRDISSTYLSLWNLYVQEHTQRGYKCGTELFVLKRPMDLLSSHHSLDLNMLITQPPIVRLFVETYEMESYDPTTEDVYLEIGEKPELEIRHDKGIRLRHFVDWANKHWKLRLIDVGFRAVLYEAPDSIPCSRRVRK